MMVKYRQRSGKSNDQRHPCVSRYPDWLITKLTDYSCPKNISKKEYRRGLKMKPINHQIERTLKLITHFSANVDGDDPVGASLLHDVSGLVVTVTTIEKHMPIPGVTDGGQVDGDAHGGAGVDPSRSKNK